MAGFQNCHSGERFGRQVTEQRMNIVQLLEYHLGHAVVKVRRNRRHIGLAQRRRITTAEMKRGTALDPAEVFQSTVMRDVGGFG